MLPRAILRHVPRWVGQTPQTTFSRPEAVSTFGRLPLASTIGFVAGVVFALGFAGLSACITYSGRFKLKTYGPAMAGGAWAFVVIMMTLALVNAPDSITGVKMIVSTLAFLIMGAVFLLAAREEQSELRTKEKLLEIEFRIAELAESLKPDGPHPPIPNPQSLP